MLDWKKYRTVELYNALETLDAEAAALTAVLRESERESGSSEPDRGILARRNGVHEWIGAIEAEVERRGAGSLRRRVKA